MKKKSFKRIAALVAAALLTFSFTACGQTNSKAVTEIVVWVGADTYDQKLYEELIATYNEGQGKTDGVKLRAQYKGTAYSANILSTLNKSKSTVDVIMVMDKYFKPLVKGNNGRSLLTDLSTLVKDESTYTKDANGNNYLDLSDFPENNIYRYRYDYANKTAGGDESSPLYGIPNGSNPTVIAYNKTIFTQEGGVNIISVKESELDAYNAANGTNYKPHGYAEYTVDYAKANGMGSLKTSTTLEGEQVVKVFNDQIPMNWSELVNLARYFSKDYNYYPGSKCVYGFATEWWFSYGWSVGGDCIQWDESQNKYIFTLGDENKNYLATKDITVDGQAYSAGSVLDYNDMQYVKKHSTDADIAAYLSDGSLTAIASQYEAFTEFTALTLSNDTKVVDGKYAYSIAPDSGKMGDRTQYFASGNAAMMVTTTEELPRMNASLQLADGSGAKYEWGIAPCWQYREFGVDGVDTEEPMSGAKGELKKIGKTYDGQVYDGEFRTVNGVKVQGKQAALSMNYCYSIAGNCTDDEIAAAWKFIQFATGTAGQKIIAQSGKYVPNQMSYATSQDYLSLSSLTTDMSVAVDAANYCGIFDKAYVENSAWADDWSTPLNNLVRTGYMSLDVYFKGGQYTDKDGKTQNFNSVVPAANDKLSTYEVRLLRK